jgi:Leucine-rich repeat (LRR) protein
MIICISATLCSVFAYPCTGNATGYCQKHGDCRNLGLTTLLPCGISSKIQQLEISGNNFTTLTTGMFQGGFEAVLNLYAYSSMVTEIEDGAFSGLPNMISLSLANNYLTSLSVDAFSGIEQLQSLALYENLLTEIQADVLALFPALTTLGLEGNDISVIAAETFSANANLTDVGLPGQFSLWTRHASIVLRGY